MSMGSSQQRPTQLYILGEGRRGRRGAKTVKARTLCVYCVTLIHFNDMLKRLSGICVGHP